jgi:hypothetical protein
LAGLNCKSFASCRSGIPAGDDALRGYHVDGVIDDALDQELEARRIAGFSPGAPGSSFPV